MSTPANFFSSDSFKGSLVRLGYSIFPFFGNIILTPGFFPQGGNTRAPLFQIAVRELQNSTSGNAPEWIKNQVQTSSLVFD